MAAVVISTLIYVGLIIATMLVCRLNAAGDAARDPFNPLGLGERIEPEHKVEYHSRELTKEEWNGFLAVWESVRARFEQDPRVAVVYADLLISELLTSNTNCNLNDKYLTAHKLTRTEYSGTVNTEKLKRVMGLYNSLFDELVKTGPTHSPVRTPE